MSHASNKKHIVIFAVLLIFVAWLDANRLWDRGWSMLYFLPACYVAWYIRGRSQLCFVVLVIATAFITPAIFDASQLLGKHGIFYRIVGVLAGLLMYALMDRLRELTDQLEFANQELEARVQIRTRELKQANEQLTTEIQERRTAQQRLLQSQKMDLINQFAGGIAHDFNNMLTVILGHTHLLLDRPRIDPEIRESLQAMQEAGERAADLTRKLLVFSQHHTLQLETVPLNDVLRETERMLRALIPENIDFVLDLSLSLPPVNIDPVQFSQVVVNLVINARDAMPDGGSLLIRTSLQPTDPEHGNRLDRSSLNQHVLLEVQDTGIGMDAQTLERIFEPFFTTKAVGKGVGLGLYMVNGIVRQCQGRIRVSSTEHQGTLVQIELPPSDHAAASATLKLHPSRAGTGEIILLVEDEETLRRFQAKVLHQLGYEVISACDGQDACEKVRQFHKQIDLLLTDMVMPGLSGYQLSARLQEIQPDIKVLYMSGYHEELINQSGTSQDTLHFLAKPFSPAELAHKVRDVLG